MSAPDGWDEKSWADAVNVAGLLRVELLRLQKLIGDQGDAETIEAKFADIERLAGVGAMAASWCKS
jgi:hypothetical protein